MELIQGQSLSELMDQNCGLELPLAIDIAAQLAEALRATHHAGIYHGDVKPANILLCNRPNNDHFVKLIDFGVAGNIEPSRTLQRFSMVCGTPSYMSPEQASGETLDGRTDIYSLGVVMYEMLSGTTPIRGSYPREMLTRHRTVAPNPLRSNPRCAHIPPRIEAIVHRCLEKDPARRYQSAADLLRELSFIQMRLQSLARDALPETYSDVSMVRTSFAGLPKLTTFAAAVPANDPGRPLAGLPLPAAGSTPTPASVAAPLATKPPPVRSARPHALVSRARSQAPAWAGETRESRRPKKWRWKRNVAPLVLLAVALGYASASAAAYLTTGATSSELGFSAAKHAGRVLLGH
jgi:serine/threonine-protein kinase